MTDRALKDWIDGVPEMVRQDAIDRQVAADEARYTRDVGSAPDAATSAMFQATAEEQHSVSRYADVRTNRRFRISSHAGDSRLLTQPQCELWQAMVGNRWRSSSAYIVRGIGGVIAGDAGGTYNSPGPRSDVGLYNAFGELWDSDRDGRTQKHDESPNPTPAALTTALSDYRDAVESATGAALTALSPVTGTDPLYLAVPVANRPIADDIYYQRASLVDVTVVDISAVP